MQSFEWMKIHSRFLLLLVNCFLYSSQFIYFLQLQTNGESSKLSPNRLCFVDVVCFDFFFVCDKMKWIKCEQWKFSLCLIFRISLWWTNKCKAEPFFFLVFFFSLPFNNWSRFEYLKLFCILNVFKLIILIIFSFVKPILFRHKTNLNHFAKNVFHNFRSQWKMYVKQERKIVCFIKWKCVEKCNFSCACLIDPKYTGLSKMIRWKCEHRAMDKYIKLKTKQKKAKSLFLFAIMHLIYHFIHYWRIEINQMKNFKHKYSLIKF